jgi:hypothetical protein
LLIEDGLASACQLGERWDLAAVQRALRVDERTIWAPQMEW